MKSSFKKQAERFLREQKDYKRWLAVFLCLAVVVTIGTTAALKYRGIAVTSDDSATDAMHLEQTEGNTEEIPEGMRKHVHTADCYEMQPVLICGMTAPGDETADGVTADAGAGDAANAGAADTTQGHVHTDACYQVTGGTETLTCRTPEHTHGADCYATETVPETVTEEVTDEAGNVTTVTNTVEKEEKVLTCTTQEHTHGADCYIVEGGERTLTCTIPEGAEAAPATVAEAAAVPAATDATAPVSAESTAPVPETEGAAAPAGNTDTENTEATGETVSGHVHTDACYEMQSVLICGKEEGELELDVSGNDILSDEMNLVQTAEAGGYKVTVTYSESAEIPESAVLRVTEYDKESDEYARRCEELEYQPDALLNVGFYDGDKEIEPRKPVLVKITDTNVEEAVNYEIAHFGADGTDEMRIGATETKEGMETEFLLESFSNISLWANERKVSVSRSADFAALGELAHEKTVEPGAKDTDGNVKYYDLTLNVKGAAGSRPGNAKLDILFVLDTSGSMAWGVDGKGSKGPSRLEQATTSIENLVTDLEADPSINAQYKLITFASEANTRGAGSWMNGNTLVARLPEGATGGTNYEDALEEAAAAISNGRSDAEQIILFLTDGAPTYYNNSEGKTKGPGSRTDTTCINEAKSGAGKIAATNACEYFYAVGYGAEMTKDTVICSPDWTPKKILTEVAEETNSSKGYYVETTLDLIQFFEKFKQGLTSISAVDVSFTDALTNKVQLVDLVDEEGKTVDKPAGEVWIPRIEGTKKDGTKIVKEGAAACYDYCGMTVSYGDGDKTKVVVDFADTYVLEENFVYSITAKIAPTKEAQDDYISNDYKYPEANTEEGKTAGTGRGEPYTGSESSERPGIYCNTEDGAKVSYKCQEVDEKGNVTSTSDEKVLPYPRPVVQVQGVTPPAQQTQDLPHRKYIKATDETDVYDLTLDVEGSSGGGKYDVLFLVDRSDSMQDRADLNESVKELYKKIKEKDRGGQNKYSLVKFDDDDDLQFDWQNASALDEDNIINNLNIGSRQKDNETDFADGLGRVIKQMDKDAIKNDEAKRVVIFLTDGIPTDGNKDETNDTIDIEEENKAVEKAKNIGCDYFYSIHYNVGLNENKEVSSHNVLTQVSSEAVKSGGVWQVVDENNKTVSRSTVDTIVNAFMGSGFTSKNVVIEDTLSEWVVLNTVEGTPARMSIKVENKEDGTPVKEVIGDIDNGATLVLNDDTGEQHTLTATYVNGKVRLDLDSANGSANGYELNPDYRYSVTIQIRPSDEAYKEAVKVESSNGTYNYPDVGGTGTDADVKVSNISEKIHGLHTNTVATVTYKRGDNTDPVTEGYQNPVIVPKPAKLTVKKTITSEVMTKEDFDKLHKGMEFSLDSGEGDKLPENGTGTSAKGTDTKTDITYTVYERKWVIPGSHTVQEQNEVMAGYRCTTTQKVNGGSETSSTTASISLEPDGEGLVEFTNHYDSVEAVIGLKKLLKDENGTVRDAAAVDEIEFSIVKEIRTIKEDGETETTYEPVADFMISDNGIGKVTKIYDGYDCGGKNKPEESILRLERGTYIISEKWEKAGDYTTVYPFKLVVSNLGEVDVATFVHENNDDAVTVGKITLGTPYDQIVVVNEIMTLEELRILKVDGQAAKPYTEGLSGAEFSLYREDGTPEGELIAKGLKYEEAAGFKGLIADQRLKNLKVGKYYLEETKAPAGYMLLTDRIEFTIEVKGRDLANHVEVTTVTPLVVKKQDAYDLATSAGRSYDVEEKDGDSHEVWTLAITNDTGAELPVTGGPGTAAYTFGGLAMIIAVSLMYGLNMRRKREKGGMM